MVLLSVDNVVVEAEVGTDGGGGAGTILGLFPFGAIGR